MKPTRPAATWRPTSAQLSLAIILMVPLAATCLIGVPTNRGVVSDSSRAEAVSSIQDRQRRVVEHLLAEDFLEDPPRQVKPWHAAAQPDADAANDQAPTQATALAFAPSRPGALPDFALPKDDIANLHESRGPPEEETFGC